MAKVEKKQNWPKSHWPKWSILPGRGGGGGHTSLARHPPGHPNWKGKRHLVPVNNLEHFPRLSCSASWMACACLRPLATPQPVNAETTPLQNGRPLAMTPNREATGSPPLPGSLARAAIGEGNPTLADFSYTPEPNTTLHFARFLSTPFELHALNSILLWPHFCPNFNFSAVLSIFRHGVRIEHHVTFRVVFLRANPK